MQKRKSYRIKWFNLLLIAMIGYFSYVYFQQQTDLHTIQREMEANQTKLKQLQQVNKDLSAEQGKLKTPEYVEKLAREELGLAKPGEVPFVPAGKN
ncbi:septum formation initiator ftsl/divic [Lucifera butyrica]|uniref:Septum formation initiator ftsl/divic n=1 Tax=Lucifera butyrica TaxID=1351585 RepID=A0A498R7Z9_9FIRM|nr:septum formation initiator family protein [Lucifera butyrica]VBB06402.1 septum formation initiator ftsl/divic [Lucifera butyrica]